MAVNEKVELATFAGGASGVWFHHLKRWKGL